MLLIISYLLNNSFYGEIARTFATMGFAMLSGAGVLILTDFEEERFIQYSFVQNDIEIAFNPLFSILVLLGAVCLTISYLIAVRSLNNLPKVLFSSNLRYQFIAFVSAISIMLVWTIFGLIGLISEISFNILLPVSFNIFFLLLIHYFYNQPFFQFNMGMSSKLLVENNLVGHIVGAITDIGPEVIVTSEEFNQRIGLDEITLETINLGATTALGINQTFSEKIGIFPVPNLESFSTILFSFGTKYEGIEDSRIKERTISIFGIIVPSALLVKLGNIKKAQEKISILVNKYSTLNEMTDFKELDDVTETILDYLIV